MSIADKLTQLDEIRSDIRDALVGKGVSASNHNFADFASDIDSISGGGSRDERFIAVGTNIELDTTAYLGGN